MAMTFTDFFNSVKDGAFGVEGSYTYIVDFIKKMWSSETVSVIKDWFFGLIAPISAAIPFILLGCYIVIALAGKRIYGVLRFLTFFVAGVLLGTYLLSPLVAKIVPQIPPALIGVVTGVVAGVLSKLLYILVIAVVAAYPVYTVCISGTVIPALTGLCKGNVVVSLICAAVALLIVILLLKYIEMLGTAMLAGLGIGYVVKGWYDFTALELFGGKAWIPMLIISSVVGIIGFVVQFRTRRRF